MPYLSVQPFIFQTEINPVQKLDFLFYFCSRCFTNILFLPPMEFGTMYSSFYCSLSTRQIADRRRSLHHCDQTFKALYILCSLTSHHRFFDFHLRECPSFEPNEYFLSLSSFSAISLQIDVESSGRVYNERSLRQRIDGQHLHYFNLHLTPVLYQSRFIP